MIKIFEEFTTTTNTLLDFCKKYKIQNYTITNDLKIDVNGSVWLRNHELGELGVKFGEVKGDFDCGNTNLDTLRGFPDKVTGSLYIERNNLKSLEYCTPLVGRNFNCSANYLTSLAGSPIKVGGYYNFKSNPYIKTTKYATSNCSAYILSENLPQEIISNRLHISEIINRQSGYTIWEGDTLNISNLNRILNRYN